MNKEGPEKIVNRGYCERCLRVVPVEREVRDNRVYLRRECPDCGPGETVISRDAKSYFEKRRMCGYVGDAQATCALNCIDCKIHRQPNLVMIDVTNRCNMNCPICVANIPAMGFEFNPPLAYFEKIFKHVSQFTPRPRVEFFGGEPTCRDDLPELLELARRYRLPVRIVSNGVRFADEEYCKKVLSFGPRILLGLDGVKPEIQTKLRKNPHSLDKKIKAIDNIEAFSKSKITILCTTGVGVSEEQLPGLVQLCHEKREIISILGLLPLEAKSGPEDVELESNTVEDIERLVTECFPGTEFVPAGMLQQLDNYQKTFNKRITFGGSHPNCETVTLMVADEHAYHPVSEYLKVPFPQFVEELVEWDRQMGPRLERGLLGRLFGRFGRKVHMGASFFRFARRRIKIRKILGPNPVWNALRMVGRKLTTGKQWKKLVRRYMGVRGLLMVTVLPYEGTGGIESARLVHCPVSFAGEHPKTGDVILVPFCSYFSFKNELLSNSSERWGTTRDKTPSALPSAVPAQDVPAEESPVPEYVASSKNR
jgi:MoaA/NifB/PqqE/SkfB family radical SAM enzyme